MFLFKNTVSREVREEETQLPSHEKVRSLDELEQGIVAKIFLANFDKLGKASLLLFHQSSVLVPFKVLLPFCIVK